MKKILVIEDNTKQRQIYEKKLAAEGLSVISAATGQEGLLLAKTEDPDLIILDIMLPEGLNGFDVLEQLKRDSQSKQIPVIVLTNLDSEEKTARAIGASDYLIKADISLEDIVNKVKECLKD